MCGIGGLISFGGADAAIDTLALERMLGALVHRGPDGSGVHVAGSVGLAHTRLAIIDPTGGQQPFVDPETGLALTYNGEVYNYREIRDELGEHDFRTTSDTEVVLRAWRRWGPAAVNRFRGMFAFAISDPRESRVYLVRDRLGIKPLYYRAHATGLAFASELSALLAADGSELGVDAAALSLYLRFGYVPTPLTIYRGVRKLEPGSILSIDLTSGSTESTRYWRPQVSMTTRTESDALAELEALLQDTLRLYVRSDVPFGVFLSGGVDSSLVAALMRQALDSPPRSFSIGFAEHRYSELPYAQTAAEMVGTSHRAAELNPELSASLLQRLAARFGEPFADSSSLPTWYVSHLAASEVKMVLSGDGGDELFAGYASYPAVLASSHSGPRARLRSALRGPRPYKRPAWATEHHRHRDAFTPDERQRLTGRPAEPVVDEDIQFPANVDPVTRCQLRDVDTYLLDDILAKVDHMSMDNSLEVRVPLLDHKLVEFAFSLPLALRLRRTPDGLVGKYLLKRAAERYFPRPFLDRPKWGFGIPIHAWLDGPLQPLVRDLLDADAGQLASLLMPGEVRRVVQAYYAGQPELAGQVWTLLSLRLWQDAVRAPAVPPGLVR